uniref:Uncharacterized protein n=1 Tax=Heterorhabditis bacteriophora TaxID=37862 RepID=A0A1I7WBW8_HETBA
MESGDLDLYIVLKRLIYLVTYGDCRS